MKINLDLDYDSSQWKRLMDLLATNGWYSLHDQIKSQIIAEPTGLGAVVKDQQGHLWVRADNDDTPWRATNDSMAWESWSRIGAIEILSEGYHGG